MSDSSNEPEIRGELAKKIANQTWDCSECETENSVLAKICTNCGTPLPEKVGEGWITGSVLCSLPAVFFMFASYAVWFQDLSESEVAWAMFAYGMLHFVALAFLVVPLITLIKVAEFNKKLRYAPALLIGIYLISFAGCFGVQSEEAFENEKANTNYKGFDRSEWATTVATFPTPIPNKE